MSRLALALAAAALLGGFAASTVRSQDTAPLPSQVGFVNVQECLQRWKKREAAEKVLQAKQDALDRKFKEDRARIEEKEQRLATLNETSEDFLKLQREVDGDKLLLERDRKYEAQRLVRQQRTEFWMLYKAVVNESRAVGEAKGLACVLQWSPLTPQMDKDDPLGIIPTRAVLWADARLDLTEDVLKSLNAE